VSFQADGIEGDDHAPERFGEWIDFVAKPRK
jgi:hypothetical protein